jgi:hypothetical protein
MNTRLIRSLVAAAAIVLAGFAGTLPAGAAIAIGHRQMTPDTSPVPCGSSTAWLRLWGGTETCYSGTGTLNVRLPAVHMEQIIGSHTICLTNAGPSRPCATGPATINIKPAIFVESITIR